MTEATEPDEGKDTVKTEIRSKSPEGHKQGSPPPKKDKEMKFELVEPYPNPDTTAFRVVGIKEIKEQYIQNKNLVLKDNYL